MAFVDVLYNAAGVPLFGTRPNIVEMWSCLDPLHKKYNPERAIELFDAGWNTRGDKSYQQRHAERVDWLTHGLAEGPMSL